MPDPDQRKSRGRLAWFVALYLTSLFAFAGLVYGLRILMRP